MKLFYTNTSPYSRKVRICTIEFNIDKQIELEFCNPFDSPDKVFEFNPLGKIPILIDEKSIVVDSNLICEYLAQKTNTASFHLNNINDKTLSLYAEEITNTALKIVLEKRRESKYCSNDFIEGQKTKIINTLEFLNKNIFSQDFNFLNLNLAVALSYLNFRLPEIFWAEKFRNLEAWYEDFTKRDSFKRTRPDIVI